MDSYINKIWALINTRMLHCTRIWDFVIILNLGHECYFNHWLTQRGIHLGQSQDCDMTGLNTVTVDTDLVHNSESEAGCNVEFPFAACFLALATKQYLNSRTSIAPSLRMYVSCSTCQFQVGPRMENVKCNSNTQIRGKKQNQTTIVVFSLLCIVSKVLEKHIHTNVSFFWFHQVFVWWPMGV